MKIGTTICLLLFLIPVMAQQQRTYALKAARLFDSTAGVVIQRGFVALGTDSAVYPHGRNAEEFAFMAADGMSPAQSLQAGTVSGAELLGLASKIGTLKPGFAADVAAVRGNPLADIRATQNVIFVMRDGVVYRNDHDAIK